MTTTGATHHNTESILSLVCAGLTGVRACYAASASLSFQSLRVRSLGYRRSHLSQSQGYSDDDGEADADELAKFSDRLPKTMALLFIVMDLILVAIRMFPGDAVPLPLLEVVARVRCLRQLHLEE